MDVLLSLAAGPHRRVEIPVLLDREAGHRFAGGGNPIDDSLGPPRLDADYDRGGDIGIGPGADDGVEGELEVGSKLEPTIGMGQRQGALDVGGDLLDTGVRNVVDRDDRNVVANADASVLAPIGHDGSGFRHRYLLTTSWS